MTLTDVRNDSILTFNDSAKSLFDFNGQAPRNDKKKEPLPGMQPKKLHFMLRSLRFFKWLERKGSKDISDYLERALERV